MELPFTTILPLISMLFVLALGIFVYFHDRKSKLNALFGLFTIVLTIWLFGTFKMFASQTDAEAIFWDRFIYAGVVFVPALMYQFSIIFTNTKRPKKTLVLSYVLSFIFLLLSRTDYFVADLFKYEWGVHTQARLFHHIFLAEAIFFFYLTLKNLYLHYRSKTLTRIERIQSKFVFLSFFILIIVSLPAFAPAYKISVYPIFYISGLFFSTILAYAILKHNLMNIRVLATEFFVGITAFILLNDFFLSETLSEYLFRLGIFTAFCFIGYLLIKSALNEIKLREKLEIANNAKSEFVSIASHQLRTPLTAVKGYISMMVEGAYGKLSQELLKPLQNVYESNEKLIKLVNDLLDLSRLEAGKIEFSPTLNSLEKIVSGIIDDLKINADKKGLYLKLIEPKEALPEIMVDQPKVRQIVLNIIDNAIKYTKEGGITIRLEKTDSQERIVISDTGIGITEDEIKNLFQMFSRAASSTKLHTEGSGVGLHVAKKFIEMHQGRIWVESEGRDKGSTFYIELPLRRGSGQAIK